MQPDENSSNRGKPQAAAYSLGAERIDGRNSSESFSNYPSTVKFQNTPSQFTGYYRGSRYPQNVEEYDGPELLDADINEGAGRRIKYADFTTIDWLHDLAKDRVRVKILRSQTGLKGYLTNLYDAGQGWIIVALVGVFSGLFAGFITLSSEWLNDLKVGYCEDVWYLNRRFCCWQEPFDECVRWKRWNESSGFTGFIMYLMFAVSFACISAVLVQQYAPYAAGSGIPEVKTILNGYIMRKFLGWFTLIIKAVGLSLSVASGLSLGKEGPLVHVACCLGNIFPRIFTKYASNEARKREILSASAAAGVSVAFGAPIGGILFSLEEVSYYFPYKTLWRSFFCATIAAVSLQIVNPLRTNQLVLFQITYARPWQSFELVIYALLGVFGGLYGAFFVKMNLAVNKFRKTTEIRKWPVLEVVLICAATAILSYPHAYSRMNTSELVSLLFRDCEGSEYQEFCNPEKYTYVIGFTLLVCIIKILTTVFTFGVRVPAGIFIPSLAVGACFGRIVGSLVQLVYLAHPDWSIFSKCLKEESCINPGTYAMVGAAATLGGVTRMTVSLVVIMFELTGALTYVLPTMLAVLVSKWIGDYFGKGSIYEGLIELNGYPFLDHQHQPVVSTTVDQNMTHADQLNVVTAHDETVASLSALLEETSYKGYPVVDNRANMTLLGYIGRNEIEYVLMSTRRIRMLPEDTPCLFASKSSGTTNRGENSIPPTPAVPKLHNPSFPSTSDASLPYLENNLQLKTNASVHHDETAGRVDFRPWVDQTPVTVQPKMSMDFVLDLFRDLGLRYVIIINNGKIEGLLTKKDMLNHVVLKHD